MIVKRISLQDYSTGKEYVYTDKSGSAASIKAVDGRVGSGPPSGAGNYNTPAQQPGSPYNAPSNTGRQVSSTSKGEPTPGVAGSHADSSESTPNSASQPPSSSSPAGANYIATGGSTAGNGQTEKAPDSAAKGMAVTTAGIVVAAAGLIVGWIL